MDIVVLAAGLGKRMGGNLPKCLTPVLGKPMLHHLTDAISEANISSISPIIVIGHKGELVQQELGDHFRYATQTKQRGTADAVKAALPHIKQASTLILYGDHPNIRPETIRTIIARHANSGATLTMATVVLPNFSGERAGFERFGRIMRNEHGKISRIVEYKDANEKERALTEVNPSYFCVQSAWLTKALNSITAENVQGEYYLTDIVGFAVADGVSIETVPISAEEALGANTPEELAILTRVMNRN